MHGLYPCLDMCIYTYIVYFATNAARRNKSTNRHTDTQYTDIKLYAQLCCNQNHKSSNAVNAFHGTLHLCILWTAPLLSVTDYSGHVRACHVHICMLCEQPFGMSASQTRLFYHTVHLYRQLHLALVLNRNQLYFLLRPYDITNDITVYI